MESDDRQQDKSNQALRPSDASGDLAAEHWVGKLKRLSFEFAIELGFVLMGLALAFGWSTKLGIALAILCLRFGVADFVTAWVVARYDPDRWHGVGLAALFVAYGFSRAAIVASIVLGGSVLAMMVWDWIQPANKNRDVMLVALGTGFLCAYGYLLMTLPLAILAFGVSWFSGRRLSFAAGLTQLRLSEGQPEKTIALDFEKSFRNIAIASGVAATVLWVFIVGVIARPKMGPVVEFLLFSSAFLTPFVWGMVFVSVVCPRKMRED